MYYTGEIYVSKKNWWGKDFIYPLTKSLPISATTEEEAEQKLEEAIDKIVLSDPEFYKHFELFSILNPPI